MYAKDYHDRGTPESTSQTYVTVEIDGALERWVLTPNDRERLHVAAVDASLGVLREAGMPVDERDAHAAPGAAAREAGHADRRWE